MRGCVPCRGISAAPLRFFLCVVALLNTVDNGMKHLRVGSITVGSLTWKQGSLPVLVSLGLSIAGMLLDALLVGLVADALGEKMVRKRSNTNGSRRTREI